MTESNYIFEKGNVSYKEYKIHKYVYGLSEAYGFYMPRIYDYDSDTQIMKMQRVPNMCVADYYGDAAENVPSYVFDKIRQIIKTLYAHNVYYPDITGYNFIEYDKKIWIIDFGHAEIKEQINDEFVADFIKGKNAWNPEFK